MKWKRLKNGDWQAEGEKGDFLAWREGRSWKARYWSKDCRVHFFMVTTGALSAVKKACERHPNWEKERLNLSTETQEQQTVVEFCEWHRIPIVHIPNEGKRSKAYGAQLKRMGLWKGFPDLFVVASKKGYHGLMIELKKDKSKHVTPEQKACIEYLNTAGYRAVVCYGADEAIHEIIAYWGAL